MVKKWNYIGIFLSEDSKKELLSKIEVPVDWRIYAYHLTLAFNSDGDADDYIFNQYKQLFGKNYNLVATELGVSDRAIAVKITNISEGQNNVNHVTIATAPEAKPVESNYITNWKELEKPINLRGTVGYFTNGRVVTNLLESYIGNHPLRKIDSFQEIADSPFFLEEGLIKTYPMDRSIESISKILNLRFLQEQPKTLKDCVGAIGDSNGVIFVINGENNCNSIGIIVGSGEDNKSILESYLDKYGYFLASQQVINGEWIKYQYEKKFDCNATDIVLQAPLLYHVCKKDSVGKILKQGITPHNSRWCNFSHNDRCYFFIEPDKKNLLKWISNFKIQKKDFFETYSLLRINVKKLPKDIKFYFDPRMTNAVYTLEGISPEAIRIEKENF